MARAKIEFGTDGFRGIIADDFTFENVQRIVCAVSKYLKDSQCDKKSILIGYDPRFMADDFAKFAADKFVQMGYNVMLSANVCPTPALAYCTTIAKSCAGALMFSASHNPKNYLGVKFIPNYGGPATKEITDIIVGHIENDQDCELQECEDDKCEILISDFSEEYFEHIEKLIDFEKIKNADLKIIYDGLFSASIGYFDELLKRHEIEFEAFNDAFDPNFGGFLPEPKSKYMKHHKEGYVTLAHDGDADRFGVIDEAGSWVHPNEMLAILLKYLAQNLNKSGRMIKTVGVSALVDVVAKKLGIGIITTPVGFKWLSEKMRETATILAGEDSGGLSTGDHIPEKDGIYASLLILQMLADTEKTLVELRKELKEFAAVDFFTDRIDVKLNNEDKLDETQMWFNDLSQVAQFKITETLKIDGTKYYLGEEKTNWVLMRKSGTEPLLRFYIEADSLFNLENIKEFIRIHTS